MNLSVGIRVCVNTAVPCGTSQKCGEFVRTLRECATPLATDLSQSPYSPYSPYGTPSYVLALVNGVLTRLRISVDNTGAMQVIPDLQPVLCYVTTVSEDNNVLYAVRDSLGQDHFVPYGTNWVIGTLFPPEALAWLNSQGLGTFTAYMSGAEMKLVSQESGVVKPAQLIYKHSTGSTGNSIATTTFVSADCSTVIHQPLSVTVVMRSVTFPSGGQKVLATSTGAEAYLQEAHNLPLSLGATFFQYKVVGSTAWSSPIPAAHTPEMSGDYLYVCLHGLLPETQYVLRATIPYPGGTLYPETTFTTAAAQSVTTGAAQDITATTARAQATAHVGTGYGGTRLKVYPTSNPASIQYVGTFTATSADTDPLYLFSLNGLTSATQYTYVAELINPCDESVIATGQPMTFTTL